MSEEFPPQVPPARPPPHRNSGTGSEPVRRSARQAALRSNSEHEAQIRQVQVDNISRNLLRQEQELLGMTNSPEVAVQLSQVQKMQAKMFEMQAKMSNLELPPFPFEDLLSLDPPVPLAGAGPSGSAALVPILSETPLVKDEDSEPESEAIKPLQVLTFAAQVGIDASQLSDKKVRSIRQFMFDHDVKVEEGSGSIRSGTTNSRLTTQSLALHTMRAPSQLGSVHSERVSTRLPSGTFMTAHEGSLLTTPGVQQQFYHPQLGRVIHPVSVSEATTPRLPTARGMTREELLMYENRSFEQSPPTQSQVQSAQAHYLDKQPYIIGAALQPAGEALLRSLQGQPPPPPRAPPAQQLPSQRPQSAPHQGPSMTSSHQRTAPSPAPALDANLQQAVTKISAPEFHPHEGMVNHLQYVGKWRTLFHTYNHVLANNTILQFHLLLGSCTTPPAEQFLASHVEEIIALCADPVAGQLLRSLAVKGSAQSIGEHFMHLSSLINGGQVSPLDAPLQDTASSLPEFNLPKDVVDAAKAAYAEAGLSRMRVHLIWAWMTICEKYLCVPTKDEFKVWEHGLIMGKSSVFGNVMASETPVYFLNRVLAVHKQFTRHAAAKFAQATKLDPLHVFINGLPKELQFAARKALMDAGVDRTSPERLILAVAEMVRNHHAFSTFWEVDGSALGEKQREFPKAQDRKYPLPSKYEENKYNRRQAYLNRLAGQAPAQAATLQTNAEVPAQAAQRTTPVTGAELTYPPGVHPSRSSNRPGQGQRQPGRGRGLGAGGDARQQPTPPPGGWKCLLCGSPAHSFKNCDALADAQAHVQHRRDNGQFRERVSPSAHAPAPGPPQGASPSTGPQHRSSGPPARTTAAAGGVSRQETRTRIEVVTDSDSDTGDDHYASRRVSFPTSSFCAVEFPIGTSSFPVGTSSFPVGTHDLSPNTTGALAQPCFAGQSAVGIPTLSRNTRITHALQELSALHAERNSPVLDVQGDLVALRDTFKILSDVCNSTLATVSAGAVQESYTRDCKEPVPESFVPMVINAGLGKLPRGEVNPVIASRSSPMGGRTNPAGAKSDLYEPTTRVFLPSQAGVSNSPLIPSALKQTIAPPCDPPAFVDTRRSSAVRATPVDNSEVNQETSEPKPLPFLIDESKLMPDSSYPIPGTLKWPAIIDTPVSMLADAKDSFLSSQDLSAKCDLVDRYVSNLAGTLSYFAPAAQVGVEYEGIKHSEPRTMLDLGSNVSLVDNKWCVEKGIPILPTQLSLNTSNATGTGVLGTTPMCTVSYGSPPHEVRTQHAFLVVPYRKKAPFRVLIGNGDAMSLGGIQDLGTNAFSIRTQYSTLGTRSPVLSYPLISSLP